MEHIKEIVLLTVAKVDILKIKADHYTWSALLSNTDRESLESTLANINNLLKELSDES